MVVIDYKDTRPLYEQIAEKFEHLILKEVLKPEVQLPSVRNLAIDLSINPNTIQRAYAYLEQNGYIYSVKGKGSFVADNAKLKNARKRDVFCRFGALVEEAEELGITKDELEEHLKEMRRKNND